MAYTLFDLHRKDAALDYPRGGFGAIAEALATVVEQTGSSVHVRAPVADVLVDLGIDSRRMQVKGYGEAHPLAENASAKGRAQNRRVEVTISNDNQPVSPRSVSQIQQ
jgi:phytoene dehydrogenase-like protein